MVVNSVTQEQRLSVREIARLLTSKEASSKEIVEHSIAVIEEKNPEINAFVALSFDSAIDGAKQVDEARARGAFLKPLAGIPFGVKDLEDCESMPTTFGSLLHKDAPPAKANSQFVQRFIDLGAIPIGKTNTPEFGSLGITDNKIFGPTRNPFNTAHQAGGSSGGSAAAVASGMVPFATGSDGGGSLRIPSAVCGLPVLKVTHGRFAYTNSEPPSWGGLSTVGPIASTIEDIAWLCDLTVGPHPDDMYCLDQKDKDWAIELFAEVKPMRILASYTMGFTEIDDQVRDRFDQLLTMLRGSGHEVIVVEDLFSTPPILPWLDLVRGYFGELFGEIVDSPTGGLLTDAVRQYTRRGASMDARTFIAAHKHQWKVAHYIQERTSGFDLLVTPTTAGLPPTIGGGPMINGKEVIDWIAFTAVFNMTAAPVASVPIGRADNNLPIGAQIVGRRFDEVKVLKLARSIEEQLGRVIAP